MVYELVKELPEERVQKILNETRVIRELRLESCPITLSLKDDGFIKNFESNWHYIVIDHESEHFLLHVGGEGMIDLVEERYLFYFKGQYYFFSMNYSSEIEQTVIMFYKETLPPKNPQQFEMLVEDLRQAFLCGDWSMKGLMHIFDGTEQDMLHEREKEILNFKVLEKLDDIDETTEYL